MGVKRGFDFDPIVEAIDRGEVIAWTAWDPREWWLPSSEGDWNRWSVDCPMCGEKHVWEGDHNLRGSVILGAIPAPCQLEQNLTLVNKNQKRRMGSVLGAINRKPILAEVKEAAWAKSMGRCWYCGTDLLIRGLFYGHIDHVRPIALGGSNDIANLVAACRDCNVSKGSKSLEQFRAVRGTFWFETQDALR